jgi:hypothetical protein
MEPVEFSLDEHERSLAPHAEAAAQFTARRQAAFEAERRAWQRQATAAQPNGGRATGVEEEAA